MLSNANIYMQQDACYKDPNLFFIYIKKYLFKNNVHLVQSPRATRGRWLQINGHFMEICVMITVNPSLKHVKIVEIR